MQRGVWSGMAVWWTPNCTLLCCSWTLGARQVALPLGVAYGMYGTPCNDGWPRVVSNWRRHLESWEIYEKKYLSRGCPKISFEDRNVWIVHDRRPAVELGYMLEWPFHREAQVVVKGRYSLQQLLNLSFCQSIMVLSRGVGWLCEEITKTCKVFKQLRLWTKENWFEDVQCLPTSIRPISSRYLQSISNYRLSFNINDLHPTQTRKHFCTCYGWQVKLHSIYLPLEIVNEIKI